MTYKHHDDGEEYKVVSYVDVNEFLDFAKKEFKSLEEEINEEKRIEKQLKEFIKHIEQHSNHKIHFIGHDKTLGTHMMRFLFKDGGFMEILVEKPLSINAHFTDKKSAEKFAKGLRKALQKALPEHPIKKMVIDSVEVNDGFNDDHLTLGKWTRMHQIAIHNTLVITITVIIIFFILELGKELIRELTVHFFELKSVYISLIMAIIVAVFFEKIKGRVENLIKKILH